MSGHRFTRHKALIILVLITWMAGLLATIMPAKWNLERSLGLELLFHWRGDRPSPENVYIISLDRASADKLDQGDNPVTWDRRLHALLVNVLSSIGARVISFDVYFGKRGLERCNNSIQDQEFAKAISKAGNVLLYLDLDTEFTDSSSKQIRYETQNPPLPCLAESAAGIAPFALPKIPSRVDQFWLIKPSAGDLISLPALTAIEYARPYWESYCQLTAKHFQAFRDIDCSTPLPKGNALTNAVLNWRAGINADVDLDNIIATNADQSTQYEKAAFQALHRILIGNKTLFLNYYGPNRTIKTIPFHQVFSMNMSILSELKGKAVFIGTSELRQSQRDEFETVFRNQQYGLDLTGVEIGATAFANLLDGSEIRPAPQIINFFGLLLTALLVSWAVLFLSPTFILLTTITLVFSILLTSYLAFSSYYLWLGFTVPLFIQIPIAMPLGLFWRFQSAKFEREKVGTALKRLLPADVVQSIVSGRDSTVEGKVLQGVCLFTDGKQYATLSETQNPAALREFLNHYYKALFSPVENHDGFVSDIIGDAMMALWVNTKKDRPNEDQQQTIRSQACLAALEVINNVEAFNQEHSPGLPTRIGLDAGEVSLGNVGAGGHFEFRAVGDTVNTASRIEGLNKELQTWVLGSYEAIKHVDSIITRDLGFFKLKGKKNLTRIFEIICHHNQANQVIFRKITMFAKGLNYYQKNDIGNALQAFDYMLEIFPKDGPTLYYRKRCLEQLKEDKAKLHGITSEDVT